MAEQNGIEPTRLYTFEAAARLVPSVYRGKHVTTATLHRWRREGKVRAQQRTYRGRRCYLILGSELLAAIAARKPEYYPPG